MGDLVTASEARDQASPGQNQITRSSEWSINAIKRPLPIFGNREIS